MRGEHARRLWRPWRACGSPPHARGAQHQAPGRLPRGGITPACAGSTCRRSRARRPGTDHPRMRGEHLGSLKASGLRDHPRMRGEHGRRPFSRQAPRGSPPACAGSTCGRALAEHEIGDHPRMRGEHLAFLINNSTNMGSPPHARGARVGLDVERAHGGITPACAGSTSLTSGLTPAPPDHPRMRGEHFQDTPRSAQRRGSPPHARGARDVEPGRDRGQGITPACAGSTSSLRPATLVSPDHPRMRGEH